MIGVFMRHCCEFKPDDIYYLDESDMYNKSRLSIGFCPICGKPVAELVRICYDGTYERISKSGIKANDFVLRFKNKIIYSLKELNYRKYKSKPYSWIYGLNKNVKIKGEIKTKQYACDFYGNKELIKTV